MKSSHRNKDIKKISGLLILDEAYLLTDQHVRIKVHGVLVLVQELLQLLVAPKPLVAPLFVAAFQQVRAVADHYN